MIDQNIVRNTFEYKNGNLFWRNCKSQKQAGSINSDGYIKIQLNKKRYSAHKLIYLYHYGYMPKILDHIDGNRSNNFIENLREADYCENSWNSKIRSTNKSGVKGVCWQSGKWIAMIKARGQKIYLGYFSNIEDAEIAVKQARKSHHKEFAKHESSY